MLPQEYKNFSWRWQNPLRRIVCKSLTQSNFSQHGWSYHSHSRLFSNLRKWYLWFFILLGWPILLYSRLFWGNMYHVMSWVHLVDHVLRIVNQLLLKYNHWFSLCIKSTRWMKLVDQKKKNASHLIRYLI